MKRQIRRNVFETNSSSTHSLIICSKKDIEDWKENRIVYDTFREKFVVMEISEEDKKAAEKEYNNASDLFWKDWNELSNKEKHSWYLMYFKKHSSTGYGLQTYEEYTASGYSSTKEKTYITEHGEEITAISKYTF